MQTVHLSKLVLASLIFSFTSCSESGTKTEAAKETKNQSASGPFEISDKSGKVGIKVTDDKSIFMEDKKIGSLDYKENAILDTAGKVVVRLDKNNLLLDVNNKTLAHVDSAGRISNGSGTDIFWSDKGELMKGAENSGYVIKPADPGLYKFASILVFSAMMFQTPAENIPPAQ